jgi:hypothetical protein
MCDYSLHAHPNRLAVEGETLVVTRFTGGSKGFASLEEMRRRRNAEDRSAWQQLWDGIRSWGRKPAACGPLTAVCIPPGAELLLEGIAPPLREMLGVSQTEHVTFTQLGYESYSYRDAVRFRNGREILIQRLSDHQTATVLSMGGEEETVRGAREFLEESFFADR